MTTLEVLIAARKLIERPENWCQKRPFAERSGHMAHCAVSALSLADNCGSVSNEIIERFYALIPEGSLSLFNDTHTHAEVLALFDRAIKAEKQRIVGELRAELHRETAERLDAEEREGDREGLPKFNPKPVWKTADDLTRHWRMSSARLRDEDRAQTCVVHEGGPGMTSVVPVALKAFDEFQKIPRLNRECIITEKIDGTNASIFIPEIPGETGDKPFLVGSRSRWITPETDNHGFARWAYENAETLLKLGPGHHFGEWWGSGIQRGYGLPKGEKRFSLLNSGRWVPRSEPKEEAQEYVPEGLFVVPIIARGPFGTETWEGAMYMLRQRGSFAAPGFMRPEGIVVFHAQGRLLFKATLEKDELPKGIANAQKE